MLTGIKIKCNPINSQEKFVSQWMCCGKYIWNAKTIEEKKQRAELNSAETKKYPLINASYSLKNKEEKSWLFECPSVILKNFISNWYKTYNKFFKGICGRPQRKRKSGKGSIHF